MNTSRILQGEWIVTYFDLEDQHCPQFRLMNIEIHHVLFLPARELQVLLGLVLAEGRHSGEEGAALDAGLGQDEQEGAAEGQVSEQELEVPQDAVGDRLHTKHLQGSIRLSFFQLFLFLPE